MRAGMTALVATNFLFFVCVTKHLDGLDSQPFTQAVVNEIVRLKVNRYALLSSEALELS
jgi:hypothetical protein